MTPLFEESGYEPSRLVAFAGNELERRSENRFADCLSEALGRSDASTFVVAGGRLLLKGAGTHANPLFAIDELKALGGDRSAAVLLGYTSDGGPRLIVPGAVAPDELPVDVTAVGYRSVFAEGLLPPALLGEFAQGVSLLAWNESCRHCGFCGFATEAVAGGYRRYCGSCEKTYFPRSDPAVIMLAVDEQRDCCLLGRSPQFRPGVYSCLAGFVEPGETIEAAVRRETQEEAGVTLGRVRYHASQPWPFPHSLMIGCYGEALTREIRRDEAELEGCRWFERHELKQMLRGTSAAGYALPYEGSIAYRLIDDWVGGW